MKLLINSAVFSAKGGGKNVLQVHIKEAGYSTHTVLKEINFEIHRGELVGLIGANGAGKSTTIKAILGLIELKSGEIVFDSIAHRYAYIPEQPIYYEGLTLWEHFELGAVSFDLKRVEWEDRAVALLKTFHLFSHRHEFPQNFSKGMQQKGLICLASLLEPDLYIIDEPFIGLDPLAIKAFVNLLEKEKERGAGILMSTHVMDSAEKLCDRFLFLSNGALVAEGDLSTIKEEHKLPKEASLLDCFSLILERDLS